MIDMERLHTWDGFEEWEPSNNDLEPTEPEPGDYAPFWDDEREWIEPHPDMMGYRCSAGWDHVPRQRRWVDPVGLARLERLPESPHRLYPAGEGS